MRAIGGAFGTGDRSARRQGPPRLSWTRGWHWTRRPNRDDKAASGVVVVDREAFPRGAAHPTARGLHRAGRRHRRRCRAVATAKGASAGGDARIGARSAPSSRSGAGPPVARSGAGCRRAQPASDPVRGSPHARRPWGRKRRAADDPGRTGGAGRRRPGGGRCAGVRTPRRGCVEDRRRGKPSGSGRSVQRRSAARPAGCRLADGATRRAFAKPIARSW